MIRLYPNQLTEKLKKELNKIYFLCGNDPLLLQESESAIRKTALVHGFLEYHIFKINNDADWSDFLLLCKTRNLFCNRHIIKILFLEKNSTRIFINNKIDMLVGILHQDLLIIIQGYQIKKTLKSSCWFAKLEKVSVIIICHTPEKKNLLKWISDRSKKNNLRLDNSVYKLLYHYYEGNLIALSQMLDRLVLLWPDENITVDHIKKMVNNDAYFTVYHWVESLLEGDINRTLYVLQQLRLEGKEPILLLRVLQRELFLLKMLKNQSKDISIFLLLNKHNVWEQHRIIIIKALNRLSFNHIRQAIQFLTLIELILKKNYEKYIWHYIEKLSILLCCQNFMENFFYHDLQELDEF